MLLHTAIGILANPGMCWMHIDYAEKLLRIFVKQMPEMYGSSSLSYTIHCRVSQIFTFFLVSKCTEFFPILLCPLIVNIYIKKYFRKSILAICKIPFFVKNLNFTHFLNKNTRMFKKICILGIINYTLFNWDLERTFLSFFLLSLATSIKFCCIMSDLYPPTKS